VLKAVRHGQCFMGPDAGMRTNVYTCAKHDLPAGTILDGIGGYECYGIIEAEDSKGLPIGLAEGVTLKRSVSKDERIALSDVSYDPDRLDFRLYAETLALTQNGAKA